MDWKNIKDTLDSLPGCIIGEEDEYRSYSVMMPIIEKDNKLHVMFEVRPSTLRMDPGEICFPGGGILKGEAARDAALREAEEELGIDRKYIQLTEGEDILVTQNNRIIHTFCGYVDNKAEIKPSPVEVESIFYVPLEYFMAQEPEISQICIDTAPVEKLPFSEIYGKAYSWRKGKSKVYFYRHENYIIWGITAKVLHSYISKIKRGLSREIPLSKYIE